MISPNFTVDDIHEVRVKRAAQYAAMPKEEAEKDFKERVRKANELMRSLKEKDAKQ